MHSVPDPTKKRKGEQWARAQSYKISRSATEKLNQLENIVDGHLAWFDQHNTVSKLIELRRPIQQKVQQRKRTSTDSDVSMHTAPDEIDDDQVQLVRSSRHSINPGEGTSIMRSSISRRSRSEKRSEENQNSADYMDPELIPSEIPEWATSPELKMKLQSQKSGDGDKIFGPISPLELATVFDRRQ